MRCLSACWRGCCEGWRARRDSNPRPSGPQPDALSAELRARGAAPDLRGSVAEREGFEPSKQVTPLNGLANRRTRPLCDLSAGGSEATTGSLENGLRESVRIGSASPLACRERTSPLTDRDTPTKPPEVSDTDLAAITVGERVPHNARVTLTDYDPRWPQLFEREARRIRAALGDAVVELEHTGSTSVPGLAAKPIIDITLLVPDSADEAAYVPQLERAG